MARGGKRVQRAKRSLAQSGGKNTTFGGGKGGGVWQGKAGGAKQQTVSKVTHRPGTGKVTIRKTGGDQSTVAGGLGGVKAGPNLSMLQGNRVTHNPKPKLRHGAPKQRGGSTQ